MLSQKVTEEKFSVSKWLKHQVLLDSDEMEACLKMLGPFEFYNVSALAPLQELLISHEKFLKAYRSYIDDLKNGKFPTLDRPIFSAVATMDSEALYAKEIQQSHQESKWIAKLTKPVLQLQHHCFFASKVDHKIHPMVLSPESIHWGLQFAFPQIVLSGASYKKTSDEKEFPNTVLFAKLVKWLRMVSVPTTFIWDGHKVASPVRLGKQCFSWISHHPGLIKQGIEVHVY